MYDDEDFEFKKNSSTKKRDNDIENDEIVKSPPSISKNEKLLSFVEKRFEQKQMIH